MRKEERGKSHTAPRGSQQQLGTAAECRGDRPIPGEGEVPGSSACCHWGREAVNRRDAEESRWRTHFLLIGFLQLIYSQTLVARTSNRDVSSRAWSPSPDIAGAEGGRSVVQHSRATYYVRVSDL